MQWKPGRAVSWSALALILGGCAAALPLKGQDNLPEMPLWHDKMGQLTAEPEQGLLIASPNATARSVTSYDEVMQLRWAADEEADIGLAHPVLPVPSYVEVTRLDTGKTILVRVARRANSNVPSQGRLSSAAARLLALGDEGQAAFRVRRVNPTDQDRQALQAGQSATARLDTPDMLLIVLRKKAAALSPNLAAKAGLDRSARLHPQQNSGAALAADRAKKAQAEPAPRRASSPDEGPWFVQIAALSSADRARQLAAEQGGRIVAANGLFRVRTGPYASRNAASAALGRLSLNGYPDARITR